MPHKVENPRPYNQWLDQVMIACTEEPQMASELIQEQLFPTADALSERDPTDWDWEDLPCNATIVLLCGIHKDGNMAISCIPNPQAAGMDVQTLDSPLLAEIAGFWHKGNFNRNLLFQWQNEEKIYGIRVLYCKEAKHEEDRKRWYKLATGIDPDAPVKETKAEVSCSQSGSDTK
jgi:hypothetical protein